MAENTCDKTSEINTVQGTARVSAPTQEADHPVQFTGIVVTYNEERHLRDCLNSLAFCEQLIVIDLGSTDASVEIARQYGAEVVHHERVPVVEQIWEEAVTYARNDWVILLDPDEVLPAGIEDDLPLLIVKDPNLGLIKIPQQYYFIGKPLHCTKWGRAGERSVVHHRKRVRFSANVHRGTQLLNGYTVGVLSRKSADYCIRHYWVDSYRQLFEKHWRYIKYEGDSRYNTGQRFSWSFMVKTSYRALKANLVDYRGLLGGFTGVFLSFFHSWYTLMSWLSLRKYERDQQALQKKDG